MLRDFCGSLKDFQHFYLARRNKYYMELTPVEERNGFYFKRDDLFEYAGVRGGKARTAKFLCQKATKGLVTAGARHSPQIVIIGRISLKKKLPYHAHTSIGELSEEILSLKQYPTIQIQQHKPGYNTVIISRAQEDAKKMNWTYIPFGMMCWEAVEQTASQVENLPIQDIERIVASVGSGMSFCGVAMGCHRKGWNIPIVGISVGKDPMKTIQTFAPFGGFGKNISVVRAKVGYSTYVEENVFQGIELDPIYEAKMIPYLQKGDLIWLIGCRIS